jgi:hypothetical protein
MVRIINRFTLTGPSAQSNRIRLTDFEPRAAQMSRTGSTWRISPPHMVGVRGRAQGVVDQLALGLFHAQDVVR